MCLIFWEFLFQNELQFRLSYKSDGYVCGTFVKSLVALLCLFWPNTVLPRLLWPYLLIFDDAHTPELCGWGVAVCTGASRDAASESRCEVTRCKDLLPPPVWTPFTWGDPSSFPKPIGLLVLSCLYLILPSHVQELIQSPSRQTFLFLSVSRLVPAQFCLLLFSGIFFSTLLYGMSLIIQIWVKLLSLITFLSNFPCPLITFEHIILCNQMTSDIRKNVSLYLAWYSSMSTQVWFPVALCVLCVASITTGCIASRIVMNGVGHKERAQYLFVGRSLCLKSLLPLTSGDEVVFFLVNLLRY